MEQEILTKAKKMLESADIGTNDCKHYNDGFMDGVEYAIKALRQPLVSCSVCEGCKFDKKCNMQDQGFFKEICRYFEQTDR